MKAAIVNPYFDTLGGGERYTMAVATTLVKLGYSVFLQWSDETIKEKLEARFGIQLKGVQIVDDVKRGDGYDVCFWLSDGSIPLLRAKKNIIHFQFPFQGVNDRTLLNKMKLWRVNSVVCNSEFTKRFIDREFGVNSVVVYPPVDTVSFKPKRKKENKIVYVGRFSALTQSKRQDVLVDVFHELQKQGYKNWRLGLIGGAEIGAGHILSDLKKKARGLSVDFLEGATFAKLRDYVGKSKLFWSASGFEIDETKEPVKVEHFGITVVEAMSAGAVPLVYKTGGHLEIVDNNNGYLWETKEQLLNQTIKLINDPKTWRSYSMRAITESKKYSYERFEKEFSAII